MIPWKSHEYLRRDFSNDTGKAMGEGGKPHSWQGWVGGGPAEEGHVHYITSQSPQKLRSCGGPFNFLFPRSFLAFSKALMMIVIISSPQTACIKMKSLGVSEHVMGRGQGQS